MRILEYSPAGTGDSENLFSKMATCRPVGGLRRSIRTGSGRGIVTNPGMPDLPSSAEEATETLSIADPDRPGEVELVPPPPQAARATESASRESRCETFRNVATAVFIFIPSLVIIPCLRRMHSVFLEHFLTFPTRILETTTGKLFCWREGLRRFLFPGSATSRWVGL